MNELELITPEQAGSSRGYIQHWLSGEQPSDAAIRPIFAAVGAILTAGRATADHNS
jgi:hypothetical protein